MEGMLCQMGHLPSEATSLCEGEDMDPEQPWQQQPQQKITGLCFQMWCAVPLQTKYEGPDVLHQTYRGQEDLTPAQNNSIA
jgi:hypothetical protein